MGANDEDAVITATGLRVRLGETQALDGVDLAVPRGTVLGVLGPNGAGKTTAVRVLTTQLQPDEGTARVAGHDVVAEADAVRRSIGLAGQYAAVDERLHGRENLVMVGRLNHLPRDVARRRAAELLDRFGLVEAADRPASGYSGGMRRRLDLAAALVSRPPVLFLDEPTTGLDPRSRADLWDVIAELVGDGTTLLLTTQYLEEADRLADRIVVLDRGVVVAEGTADELKAQTGSEVLALGYRDRREADRAADVARAMPHVAAVEVLDATVQLRVEDAAAVIGRTIRGLEDRALVASAIDIRRPTLDDVFLSLTDHAPTGAAA